MMKTYLVIHSDKRAGKEVCRELYSGFSHCAARTAALCELDGSFVASFKRWESPEGTCILRVTGDGQTIWVFERG